MQIQFPFCHHDTKGVASAHEDDFGVRESLGACGTQSLLNRERCARGAALVLAEPRGSGEESRKIPVAPLASATLPRTGRRRLQAFPLWSLEGGATLPCLFVTSSAGR